MHPNLVPLQQVWDVQHEKAGADMLKLCIDLRGFYLKVSCIIGFYKVYP